MDTYSIIALREAPDQLDAAAEWFSAKWGIPADTYRECMSAYLGGGTEYGWYLCLDGESIVGGLGVIGNDFHDRTDLTPNICAVYTDEAHRGRGVAGRLLGKAVEELRSKGITPVYLATDHIGFYERYGWEFFCTAHESGGTSLTRIYIHK